MTESEEAGLLIEGPYYKIQRDQFGKFTVIKIIGTRSIYHCLVPTLTEACHIATGGSIWNTHCSQT